MVIFWSLTALVMGAVVTPLTFRRNPPIYYAACFVLGFAVGMVMGS